MASTRSTQKASAELKNQGGPTKNKSTATKLNIHEYFKKQLKENETEWGDFQTSGEFELKSTGNLGIYLKDLKEYMSFPVGKSSFEKYKEIFSPGPFSYKQNSNSKTVLDENVRKCLELTPEKFEFKHPNWDLAIDKALNKLKSVLKIGENAEIYASPYKLLLYGPGGKFAKHRDNEKGSGMFATLVVVLPSDHEGGELEIQHGEKTHSHQFGNSFAGINFIGFYADCYHQLKPITAGYRVAMTYKVCYRGNPADKPRAIDLASKVSLPEISKSWTKDFLASSKLKRGKSKNQPKLKPPPPYLVHYFSHEYTKNSFENGLVLKGQDKFFQSLIDSEDFNVYIYHINPKMTQLFSNLTAKNMPYPMLPNKVENKISESGKYHIFKRDSYFAGLAGNRPHVNHEWYHKTMIIFFPAKMYLSLISSVQDSTDSSSETDEDGFNRYDHRDPYGYDGVGLDGMPYRHIPQRGD